MFLKSSLQVNLNMGTKGQQTEREHYKRSPTMLAEIKTVYIRSGATLLQDAAGAAALIVMLGAALYMPGVF